jgi:ABC-type phosphate transport system substrate-binding protein
LIPAQISDATKRDAIKNFLKWMLVEGQTYNESLSYAQLPKPVIAKEQKAIGLIQ